MYSVLIVDDEKMIRTGIKAAIQWNKIGIDTVHLAAEGAEALEIFKREKPNILLTDIRMAKMNGIELIEEIRKTDEDVRILVLTGYDSFEYVRQCLRLQVQDFILKPIDEVALTETFRKQVEALEDERRSTQTSVGQRAQSMHEQARLEHMMRLLIDGEWDEAALNELLAPYGQSADEKVQIALFLPALPPDGTGDQGAFLNLSIKNLCFDLFDSRSQGVTFEDHAGRIAIAAFVAPEYDETYDRMEQLRQMIDDEYEVKITLAIGGVVENMNALKTSYEEAITLLNQSECPTGCISQTVHDTRRARRFSEFFGEAKRLMCNNIDDADIVAQVFDNFEKNVADFQLSNAYVRRCCFELSAACYYAWMEDTDEGVDNRLNALLVSLLGHDSVESCRLAREFVCQFEGGEQESTHSIVANTKQYIRDHLADDLSVSKIAGQIYINTNYFSRLFKKVTGEGCNEYIVRKRVERAKTLLESTDYKAGKIAEMVGYRDANYFSLAFKKCTGVSPTGYRNTYKASL